MASYLQCDHLIDIAESLINIKTYSVCLASLASSSELSLHKAK
jgi:hypothetical protein